jgi:hypothetical protein
MKERLDLIGAITAHVIFLSSIVTFSARMILRTKPGSWIGIPILLASIPLIYLLLKAPAFNRPPLYYIQIGVMLLWLAVLFIVDYILKINFRETQWMVISFVVLYFAGMGGMIGISALAGRAWTLSAVILFFVTAILAFVQRALTGY